MQDERNLVYFHFLKVHLGFSYKIEILIKNKIWH
jgi:hypothetical protein